MVVALQHPRLEEIKACARRIRDAEKKYYLGDERLDSPEIWSVGVCRNASEQLQKALDEIGIQSRLYFGLYYGSEDAYQELIAAKRGEPPEEIENWGGGWTHWWLIIEDLILDITADQFHPSEPENYEIVITALNDTAYA